MRSAAVETVPLRTVLAETFKRYLILISQGPYLSRQPGPLIDS